MSHIHKRYNRLFRYLGMTIIVVLGVISTLGTGGGSSSDNGTVTFPPPASSPPAIATVINMDNAESTALEAYDMVQSLIELNYWVGSADGTAITIGDIARIIKAKAQTLNGAGGAAGAEWNYDCFPDGDVSGDDIIDEDDGNEGRFAGTMTFNGCDDGWGFTIDGTVVYDYSWFANNDYSDHFGGDLTITITTPVNLIITLTGMDYTDNGNWSAGNYSLTVTFALSTPVGGYLLQTPTAIAGDFYDGQCALSGEALVTGGGGTQLRLTFSGGTTFLVEWSPDGSSWTVVPNTGYFYCI